MASFKISIKSDINQLLEYKSNEMSNNKSSEVSDISDSEKNPSTDGYKIDESKRNFNALDMLACVISNSKDSSSVKMSCNHVNDLKNEISIWKTELTDGENQHRVSCHKCGNIRKRKIFCSKQSCPHTYCGRCSEKMQEEYGTDVFVDGCPVCKKLCCCSNKSSCCDRQNHCYRKCPAATKSCNKNSDDKSETDEIDLTKSIGFKSNSSAGCGSDLESRNKRSKNSVLKNAALSADEVVHKQQPSAESSRVESLSLAESRSQKAQAKQMADAQNSFQFLPPFYFPPNSGLMMPPLYDPMGWASFNAFQPSPFYMPYNPYLMHTLPSGEMMAPMSTVSPANMLSMYGSQYAAVQQQIDAQKS